MKVLVKSAWGSDDPCGMAASRRNPANNHCSWHSDPCLRGVLEGLWGPGDPDGKNASFANPSILVQLIEWAGRQTAHRVKR